MQKMKKKLESYKHKPIPKNFIDSHSSLCFALGYLNDNEKNYKKASIYFERGNQLYRSSYDYDIEIEERLFLQIQRGF